MSAQAYLTLYILDLIFCALIPVCAFASQLIGRRKFDRQRNLTTMWALLCGVMLIILDEFGIIGLDDLTLITLLPVGVVSSAVAYMSQRDLPFTNRWRRVANRIYFVGFLGTIVCNLFAVYYFGFFDNHPVINLTEEDVIVFTNERPDPADSTIVVCLPGAYTSYGRILGHFSLGDGKKYGKTEGRLGTVHLHHDTYFQTHVLVENHVPREYPGQRLRYRRALCKKDGRFSIVHSQEPLSISEFAESLTDYDDAWNLDMGTYSYGWYREGDEILDLSSSSKHHREKQTSWLVVRHEPKDTAEVADTLEVID